MNRAKFEKDIKAMVSIAMGIYTSPSLFEDGEEVDPVREKDGIIRSLTETYTGMISESKNLMEDYFGRQLTREEVWQMVYPVVKAKVEELINIMQRSGV